LASAQDVVKVAGSDRSARVQAVPVLAQWGGIFKDGNPVEQAGLTNGTLYGVQAVDELGR
jgi:hypothetical protein